MKSLKELNISEKAFIMDVRTLIAIKRRINNMNKLKQQIEKELVWEIKVRTDDTLIDLGEGHPVLKINDERITVLPKTKHPREVEHWLKSDNL